MAEPKFETRYQERADLPEVFSDHLEKFVFDGNTLRTEFSIQRLDVSNASKKKPTGSRVPVCRLVLTPSATLELYNKLRNLVGVLEKRNLVRKEEQKPQKIQ